MPKKTIEQVDVAGKRVLMRVDFNVPTEDGRISDDRRIRMAMPSIKSVLDRGGRLVLISHRGRPGGKGYEAEFSLAVVARRLEELLADVPVEFPSHDCIDDEAAAAVSSTSDGDVLLLENLRFHAGEKGGDAAFAAALAEHGEIYCNDAFGTAHRADASMVALPRAMEGRPRVAGLLMRKELQYLGDLIDAPPRPFTAVLGGAKVSDKLVAIRNLAERVDAIVIGGAMAYTFLAAQGRAVGKSRVEPEMLGEARTCLEQCGSKLLLPHDHVGGREIARGTEVKVFEGDIEDGWMGLDIGPATRAAFTKALADVRGVVWNGPMGVFETPPFDAGTRAIADALTAATARGATTVVGGGDTAAAVESFGLAAGFSHVSTGGGASLEMLEGRPFESVEALDDA